MSDVKELSSIIFNDSDCVGITSGASTQEELIQEVLQFMCENNEVQQENFGEMLEKQENESVVIRVGAVIENAVVLEAKEEGVLINLGSKNDGFIPKEEVVLEGEYNPADFAADTKVGVIITGPRNNDTGLIPASKKKLDAINKGNEIVDTIRNGEEFELKVLDMVDKGLTSKLGNYRVFIPQSQVEEHFVRNLKPFVGRTLRLRALEIDDKRHKIVASQKVILAEERIAKETEFFDNIFVDAVVIGKVMRSTKFGAFVNVGGFDCLAHIADLSWGKISKVEEVLTIGQEYEFVVLRIDREKKRVSLGYKQLHLHPFNEFISKHGVGDVVDGTVVRLKEFGAFVKIAEGVDGLVHISEASHTFVKNITEVLKVGDEVKVMITKIDEENRKISLSIKAATEPPILAEAEEAVEQQTRKPRGERKPRAEKNPDEQKTWNEDTSNNPFADLLKGIKTED
jgi:4-hydroxy-3-methylbut-2-enyl diphosphate reductase